MQSDLEIMVNEDMSNRGYDHNDINDSILYWKEMLRTEDINIEKYKKVYENERNTLH